VERVRGGDVKAGPGRVDLLFMADGDAGDPGHEPVPDGARGGFDADALRRLRLGQGRGEDLFLSAVEPLARVVPVRSYSRWRSGPTAFGPVGRVVATLLVLGAAWLVLNPLTALVLAPLVLLVLRGIWHRELQPLPVLRDQRLGPRSTPGRLPPASS
jgi:hypothetical protein